LNPAVSCALASLACAGVSDVVFRVYSRQRRPRGAYVMGVGIVWTILQGALVLMEGGGATFGMTLALLGLGAGVLVAFSNLLLVASLAHVEVSLAATIYRLNTIVVIVLAVVLLGEGVTGEKVLGVLFGLAAIALLFRRSETTEVRTRFLLGFGLAVTAAILRAGFGILSKFAQMEGADLQVMLLVCAPVWILVGAAYGFVREGGIKPSRALVRFSCLSGALICGVANFLAMGLARGEASVVVPIANMSFLFAIFLAAGLGLERLSARSLFAALLAAIAIVLLASA
jgi:drug/metabolite transporter (DMT)-like permease